MLESNKVNNSLGYSGTLDLRVEEYLYGLAPRLVQSIKSSRIYNDQSLTKWLISYFEISSNKAKGLCMKTDCYGLLVHLLTKMSEGKYPQNALVHHVELLLPQVRSWLLATLNMGRLFGCPEVPIMEQKLFFVKYFQLGLKGLGEKVLKFHLNYIFSKATRQPDLEKFVLREKPPQELGLCGFLFGGAYRTWVARKLFCKKGLNQKRLGMAFTFLQSKRGWDPISRALVRDSLLKHAKALSAPREKEEFVIRGIRYPFRRLKDEITRTVDELFPKKRFTSAAFGQTEKIFERKWDLPHNVPSLSAAFECTRPDGGSLSHFAERFAHSNGKRHRKKRDRRDPNYEKDLVNDLVEDRNTVDLLLFFGSFSSELVGYLEVNGVPFEIRGFPRWEQLEQADSLRRHQLTRAFKCLFGCEPDGKEAEERFLYEKEYDSEVHIVLEPAKARIITAGPPGAYHLSRSFQKVIHQNLRSHAVFRLIGEPLTGEVMEDFARKIRVNRDSCFMSADYSAATDNLHGSLIRACANRLMDNIGLHPFERETYLRSLQDHRIHYPIQKHPYHCRMGFENPPRKADRVDVEDDCFFEPAPSLGIPPELGIDSFDQQSGQLMGSPSSFPILCLINAAVNRFFWERTIGTTDTQTGARDELREKFRLDQIPMLVNGDDLLTTIDQEDYDEWWTMVSICGLEPSLGKNYVSKDFAMLNSQIYLQGRDLFGCHAYWERVPYVNLGLLRGQSKVLGDTRRADRDEILSSDLVSSASFLLEGFSGDQRERLFSLWISLNLDKIKSVTFPGQNWFIPQQLGGLGLPLPQGFSVTRGQGKLASFLRSTKDLEQVPTLSAPKPTYLRMEKIVSGHLKDLVEWEWSDERREERAQLPRLTRFFEIWSGEEVELHPKEKAYDRELSRRKWDALWTRGTDHRMDPMTNEEICNWGTRYLVPVERTKITSTALTSTLFREKEMDLSIPFDSDDVEVSADRNDLCSESTRCPQGWTMDSTGLRV